MSEGEIFTFRFLLIYAIGCLCHLTNLVRNLDFYVEQYAIYCENHKYKNTRFRRAFMFAALNVTWPLDIILTIYFKYFYSGGND